MNRLTLNILLLAGLLAIEAKAEVPKPCRNNAMLDSFLANSTSNADWLKNCASFLESLNTIEATVRSMVQKTTKITVSTDGNQAQALDNLAAAAGSGGDVQSQKAKIAEYTKDAYSKLVTQVNNRIDKLDRVVNDLGPKYTGVEKDNFETTAENAKKELKAIRDQALARAYATDTLATGFKQSADVLNNQSDAAAAAAASLKNGETPNTPPPQKSSGVSGNTMVALGGAAVIAAGTVGGIYVVGNQIEKNANKDSKKRIEQAEQAALNVVNAAEQSAKNVIQFASDQANQVLANAEETGQKLIDMAKNNFAEMIPTLSAELSSSMSKLSTERLEKLNSELNAVFDAQIAKATASGDQTLVDNLVKAKASVNKQIEDELKRRHDAILTG